jgi:hypothetical protein
VSLRWMSRPSSIGNCVCSTFVHESHAVMLMSRVANNAPLRCYQAYTDGMLHTQLSYWQYIFDVDACKKKFGEQRRMYVDGALARTEVSCREIHDFVRMHKLACLHFSFILCDSHSKQLNIRKFNRMHCSPTLSCSFVVDQEVNGRPQCA